MTGIAAPASKIAAGLRLVLRRIAQRWGFLMESLSIAGELECDLARLLC